MKIKVLIADDNSFIREGLKIILNSFPEFEVVAAVGDGAEAVAYCKGNDVDIALLDVRMPHMNGVAATRLLTKETKVKPLILTTFDDDEYIVEAIQSGAKGYLLKNNDPERLRDAIKSVYNDHHVLQDVALEKIMRASGSAAGELASTPMREPAKSAGAPMLVDPAADDRVNNGQTRRPDDARTTTQTQSTLTAPSTKIDCSLFTERELQIMAEIANGLTNKEISQKLFLSAGTTANYITSILNKTGLSHRTQIAIYYLTGEIRAAETTKTNDRTE